MTDGIDASLQSVFNRRCGKGRARLAEAGGTVNMQAAAKKSVSMGSLVPVAQQLHEKERAKVPPRPSDAKSSAGKSLLVSAEARRALAARAKSQRRIAIFSPRGSRVDTPGGDSQPATRALSMFDRVMNIANSVTFQTILYISYVFVFQSLANTLRTGDEYIFDRRVMETFIKKPFDAQGHRAFMSIRRIADFYEWGNKVLWPGLFGDMGPCNRTSVGMRDWASTKQCMDDAWPDGEGTLGLRSANTPTHNLRGPTPLDLFEMVRRMDQLDWTEGLTIRVARTRAQPCNGSTRLPTWWQGEVVPSPPPPPPVWTHCGPFVPAGACDRGGEETLVSLIDGDGNVTVEECRNACQAQGVDGCCWRRPSGLGPGACRFADASNWYPFGDASTRSATSCSHNLTDPNVIEAYKAVGFAPPPPSPPSPPTIPPSPPAAVSPPISPPSSPPRPAFDVAGLTAGVSDEPPPHLLDASLPPGYCYPELAFGTGWAEPYGRNFTYPGEPMDEPFVHFTSEELGSNPAGQKSASLASITREAYETAGYVAVVIPFFSEEVYRPQQGLPEEIDDFRTYYVNTTNARSARYYCVRLSHNGRHLRQLCDPTTELVEGNGEMTGAIRAAVEEMWGELKRGHFLDASTRLVTVTMQLKSNHAAIRYRLTLMLEFTSTGAVLPSYDVETRMLSEQMLNDMNFYARISLYTIIMFVSLEVLRILRTFGSRGWEGFFDYADDMWNLMDWANFFLFGFVWWEILYIERLLDEDECSSYLCAQVGVKDDWLLMSEYRTMKQYLSLNLWIQLLKVAKYTAAMVPKMSLATDTLRKCLLDLFFFGIVVINTIVAFSSTLYVQLGPQMVGFYDQFPAAVTLFRGLFTDFDLDAIMHNSQGYFNAMLMLTYLFVAVFVLLSLFLSILAEAQSKVRLDDLAIHSADPSFNEYGSLATCWRGFENCVDRVAQEFEVKNPWPDSSSDDEEDAIIMTSHGELKLDEARPLDWESVSDLRNDVTALNDAVETLVYEVDATRVAWNDQRQTAADAKQKADGEAAAALDEAASRAAAEAQLRIEQEAHLKHASLVAEAARLARIAESNHDPEDAKAAAEAKDAAVAAAAATMEEAKQAAAEAAKGVRDAAAAEEAHRAAAAAEAAASAQEARDAEAKATAEIESELRLTQELLQRLEEHDVALSRVEEHLTRQKERRIALREEKRHQKRLHANHAEYLEERSWMRYAEEQIAMQERAAMGRTSITERRWNGTTQQEQTTPLPTSQEQQWAYPRDLVEERPAEAALHDADKATASAQAAHKMHPQAILLPGDHR